MKPQDKTPSTNNKKPLPQEVWDFFGPEPKGTKLDLSKYFVNDKRHRGTAQTRQDKGIILAEFRELCVKLSVNRTITVISLAGCNISTAGLHVLGQAVSRNTTLRILDLRDNNLQSSAVKTFYGQILSNISLTNCVFEESGGADAYTKAVEREHDLRLTHIAGQINIGEVSGSASEEEKLFAYWTGRVSALMSNNAEHNQKVLVGAGSSLDLSARPDPVVLGFLMSRPWRQPLTQLWLDDCNLAELPECVNTLVQLRLLSVNGNILTTLPELDALRNLKTLSFERNKITEFPASIALLDGLEEIYAAQNEITTIPVSVIKLRSLEVMDICCNPITKPNLADKANTSIAKLILTVKKIGEEEQKKPLTDGRKKDREDCLTRLVIELKEIYASKVPVNRARLMIVGDSGVGKTKLAKSLQTELNPDKQKAKKMKSAKMELSDMGPNIATDGIDVVSIQVEPNDKKFQSSRGDSGHVEFAVWDFAGQDVYVRTLHLAAFLSRLLYSFPRPAATLVLTGAFSIPHISSFLLVVLSIFVFVIWKNKMKSHSQESSIGLNLYNQESLIPR